jgi:hypothetical protein
MSPIGKHKSGGEEKKDTRNLRKEKLGETVDVVVSQSRRSRYAMAYWR